jgi:TatA/E family protein of Tat protein translocase
MFDVGLQEMLLIGVLALLVFGPSKLPELGRMFGRAMREFRRASDEFRSTVETNLKINDPDPIIAPPSSETPTTSAVMAPLPSETEGTPAEATAITDGTDSTMVAVPGEPFSAQSGSKLFHRSSCDWVARIPAGERVEFAKISAARESGFVACPVCEPWEPA